MRHNVSESGLEQGVWSARDPRERAVRAVAAHREAREMTIRLSAARRDAIVELHATGYTWQEVADAVGMSLKSAVKAAHGADSPVCWWKRLPAEVAEQAKLGPGGRLQSEIIAKSELMEFIKKAMADRERETRRQGRGAARVSPGELAEKAGEAFGRPVPMPSLRSALYTLIEQGTVARVGHGRYVLTAKPATGPPSRHPRDRSTWRPRRAGTATT